MPPSHDPIKGNAVLFSEMTPPDGGEDTFNQWYDGHHTPNHVKGVPGFLSAMRYKSTFGPHYLAVYDLDSVDTLQSEEYKSRKFTPDDKTREILSSVSGFTRYIANEAFCMARDGDVAGAQDAAVIFCVFFAVPMERCGAFDQWYDSEHIPMLLDCPDWLMARRFDIVDWDPEPYTHLILHYLADEQALQSDALAAARATDARKAFAAEPWFIPHFVTYQRRGARFLKS
ncbi:MAG: hypothetical protein V3R85_00920 [Alphaproteobacteria bacterium]